MDNYVIFLSLLLKIQYYYFIIKQKKSTTQLKKSRRNFCMIENFETKTN